MIEHDLSPETAENLLRLGVALAIGLLIGLERGWKERDQDDGDRTAGLRTFGLIGLLGGVAALLSSSAGEFVLAAAFVVAAAAMIVFELNHARRTDVSDATPLIAQLLVFAMGATAGLGFIHEAGAAAVAAAIILAFKENLHRWLGRITFVELRAVLVLAAMSVIVLPLLPVEPIDEWGAVSPRAVWLLMLLIAAISFIGYAAIRIGGPTRGPLAAGIAGGLVSSTATVLSFSRMTRGLTDEAARPLLAGAMLANAVMFVRTALLAGALRVELMAPAAAALAPAALVCLVAAGILARSPSGVVRNNASGAVMQLDNPFSLKTAIIFGILLTLVSLASAAANDWFGDTATLIVAAVSGLADVDAVTLSMTQTTNVATNTAMLAILIAAAVNTVSKSLLAAFAGGRSAGAVISAASAAALAAGAAGYLAWSMLA